MSGVWLIRSSFPTCRPCGNVAHGSGDYNENHFAEAHVWYSDGDEEG